MEPLRWTSWLLGSWILVTTAVGLASAADADERHPPQQTSSIAPNVGGHVADLAPSSSPAPAPLPVAVSAPAVGIDAALVAVGKTPDGALAVPSFGTAGWYEHSARPGAAGAAVLAGHVDSYEGPDVFFGLHQLRPGDEVTVRRSDGSTATFVVDVVEEVDKDALPVERIFDDPAASELRLITCGGDFDRSSRSYRSNVIVYATLVGEG